MDNKKMWMPSELDEKIYTMMIKDLKSHPNFKAYKDNLCETMEDFLMLSISFMENLKSNCNSNYSDNDPAKYVAEIQFDDRANAYRNLLETESVEFLNSPFKVTDARNVNAKIDAEIKEKQLAFAENSKNKILSSVTGDKNKIWDMIINNPAINVRSIFAYAYVYEIDPSIVREALLSIAEKGGIRGTTPEKAEELAKLMLPKEVNYQDFGRPYGKREDGSVGYATRGNEIINEYGYEHENEYEDTKYSVAEKALSNAFNGLGNWNYVPLVSLDASDADTEKYYDGWTAENDAQYRTVYLNGKEIKIKDISSPEDIEAAKKSKDLMRIFAARPDLKDELKNSVMSSINHEIKKEYSKELVKVTNSHHIDLNDINIKVSKGLWPKEARELWDGKALVNAVNNIASKYKSLNKEEIINAFKNEYKTDGEILEKELNGYYDNLKATR